MLEAIHINYGLKSTTINIPVAPGTTRFQLQQNNELGLPHDALILAIQCRAHSDEIVSSVSTGITLVKDTVFQNAYLTLKDTNCNDGKINMLASQYHMENLVDKALFMENVTSERIDWNNSYIEVNQRAKNDLAKDTVFEIVVWYQDSCNTPIKNRFNFRDGTKLAGKRVKYFEVPLTQNGGKYKLSNIPNVGLPQDAIVIGFSTKKNDNPLFAIEAQSEESHRSTYFTLQKGIQQIIEDFPAQLEDYKETIFPDLDYVPRTPTEVQEINWQSSHVRVNDTTNLNANQSFQFYLFWYRPTMD